MENQKKSEKLEIVALVNDEKVTRSELDSYMGQIATINKISLPKKGSEEEKNIELQALNQVINSILLSQDAKNQGINISEEEINLQYLAIVNQVGGEEKLSQAFEKTGINEENLKKDLERQSVLEKYFDFIKEKNEIIVTEEEAQNFYNLKVLPNNPGLEFEKIKNKIFNYLEQEKINLPILEIIKNLRKEAEIKIFI